MPESIGGNHRVIYDHLKEVTFRLVKTSYYSLAPVLTPSLDASVIARGFLHLNAEDLVSPGVGYLRSQALISKK